MAKEFKITSLRLADLERELNYLKTTREREVAAMIAEARSYGDLSETPSTMPPRTSRADCMPASPRSRTFWHTPSSSRTRTRPPAALVWAAP